MNTKPGESERALAAKQRVEAGLEALRVELAPYVAKHMRDRHGAHWRHYASRAHRDESSGELDIYALLKTSLDQWSDLFRHDARLRRARSFISLALDARNSARRAPDQFRRRQDPHHARAPSSGRNGAGGLSPGAFGRNGADLRGCRCRDTRAGNPCGVRGYPRPHTGRARLCGSSHRKSHEGHVPTQTAPPALPAQCPYATLGDVRPQAN